MKRCPGTRKTSVNLSESIARQLNMYVLAAGAAGVGVLALEQPAEGKIVYTPTHIQIDLGSEELQLDLNHDANVDFFLGHGYAVFTSSGQESMFVNNHGVSKNLVAAVHDHYRRFDHNDARALRAGVSIGPAIKFPTAFQAYMGTHFGNSGNGTTHFYGRWANGGKGVKNRYLGLKFLVSGKVHYGWARLTVTLSRDLFVETLTGYAYETIPNKPIIAGRTKDPHKITVQPATLGKLALGRK